MKMDTKNKFISVFNPKNGMYMRSGVIENGIDTGIDPFMSSFPELIDVGIMGQCIHGQRGLCNTGCYQSGNTISKPNMTLENFQRIVDECKGKVYQFALGGRGDVESHDNFREIMQLCRENDIVPNFTTSGLKMTKDKARIAKEYAGAVAISWYRQNYTKTAIQLLLNAEVTTNIHYVLGRDSIDEAIERLENDSFPTGINAVIFLLYKPVGQGKERNVLKIDDKRVSYFFSLIDKKKFPFRVGFDSCSVPAIINLSKNINRESIDTCEGGRWSMYITSDMQALPCSFDQAGKWAYDISNNSVENAWNSSQFENFRNVFRNACKGCEEQVHCMGGCPITNQITLCDRACRGGESILVACGQ